MERIPTDETLILDGILRRDDSDRIGQLTRRVQAFQLAQAALHTTLFGMLTRVQDTVHATFMTLQDDIEASLVNTHDQLAALNAQAVELARDLETLLTTTGAAQVTQEELDALATSLQETTATVQDVLARTQELDNQGGDTPTDQETTHG
jgi:uncharacterized protein